MNQSASLGERITQLSSTLLEGGMTYLPSVVGAVLLLLGSHSIA